ncbi:hypothetical protein D9M68_892250 [compost metagenome]
MLATIAQYTKRLVHDFRIVVSNRARCDFIPVHYHVVLVGNNRQFLFIGIGCNKRLRTTARHTEWIVPKINFLCLVIPFVERKINNPRQGDFVRVLQLKMSGKF